PRVSSRPRLRSVSLSPSPSPRRRGANKRPKRDAYEAFSSPEANWSTIPAKKGRRNASVKGGRPRDVATRPFKMQVTLGSALRGRKEATERSPGARARVMTYLPPPPKNLNRGRAKPAPSKRTHDSGRSISSSPSFQPMAIRRVPAQPASLSFNRCSTPAREPQHQSQPFAVRPSHAGASSDTLSSNEGPYDKWDEIDDTAMSFDTPTLARRYPSVRRGVAERKHLSAQTWDILGLSSCGVVFLDEWRTQVAAGEGDKTKLEMVIVAWNGDS
ncbi:hypothetical protein C8T65DRAFT_570639, partial [Cerioporus squamosus]